MDERSFTSGYVFFLHDELALFSPSVFRSMFQSMSLYRFFFLAVVVVHGFGAVVFNCMKSENDTQKKKN